MSKYSMFIGRFQPWHEGHRWLIDQRLKLGKKVWIAVRSCEQTESQPWTRIVTGKRPINILYFDII